ncbi:MAG: short-chain dehydrogenase [Blastocatellia bacterium]|nr:MAG: short-chain dehydrogenase [Blastocatellia bacterium]
MDLEREAMPVPPDNFRVVVVTGAGGTGCGRAIAARFALRGDTVVVSDINEVGGDETVRLIERAGGRAAFFRADVRRESDARALASFAETTFGGLHVLINNASAPRGGDRLEEWTEALETDLLGAIYATRWAIESMRRGGGGAVVNIASISALWHGRRTPGGFPGYDVAKAGMICMTTRLASLAKTDRIRVNCLAPGWIATDGPRQYWESLTSSERAERGVPSRLLTTDQVADAVVRLVDDVSLAGRVLVWWSEDAPQLIQWGDRGYRDLVSF